ncbi:MAG: ArnT family glycosyltransferase [Anaerolineae bacterium]
MRGLGTVAAVLVAAALLFISFWRLDSVPPLWWDEGWTLSVARNWVELGHYGRLLNGEPVPAGLSGSFVIVAPVALSFRLLGVGIWQGRLPGVLFMLGALGMMTDLARRLYGARVAVITLGTLLLLLGPGVSPILQGRQVLGEVPMLFYLVAGYSCLLTAFRRPVAFLPLTALCWGLALASKAQPVPFWMLAVGVPIGASLFRRRWRAATILVVAALGSVALWRLMPVVQQLIVGPDLVERESLSGLRDVTALVFAVANRLSSLQILMISAPSVAAGLFYELWLRVRRQIPIVDPAVDTARLSLWVLAGSWMAWYIGASVGWARYLFPAAFLGAPFGAAMLGAILDDMSYRDIVRRAAQTMTMLRVREGARALLLILLVVWTIAVTPAVFFAHYLVGADDSVTQVATYLNDEVSDSALIETYESELFLLLDRRYHYPPDQLTVPLNRRTFVGQDVEIDYDPLAADPEYLVIGNQALVWGLYDPELVAQHFALVLETRRYQVYARAR